jgi:hypothetical protein
MARTRRNGLEYFPMDTDMFSDIKIRKLIKFQSGKAIAVYTLLLCNIYRNGYYIVWDNELPFIVSEQSGYDEAYIREAIRCCLKVGLFDSELFNKHKVLTSAGIQKRYRLIKSLSRSVCNMKEYCLIDGDGESAEGRNDEEGNVNPDMTINFANFLTLFNTYADHYDSAISRCKHIGTKRQEALQSLLAAGYTKNDIVKVMQIALSSPMLNGKGKKGFVPDFDWISKEENFVRILEGSFTYK